MLQSSQCSRHSEPRKKEKLQTIDTKRGMNVITRTVDGISDINETREQAMSDTNVDAIFGKSQQNKNGATLKGQHP